MPSNSAATRINRKRCGREDVLPCPKFSRIRVFTSEGIGKINFAPSGGNIVIVKFFNRFQMFNKSVFNG